jgi:hypothetical protein
MPSCPFANCRDIRKPWLQFDMIDLLAGVVIVAITMGCAAALQDYLPSKFSDWKWLLLPTNRYFLTAAGSVAASILASISAIRHQSAQAYGWLTISFVAVGILVTLSQLMAWCVCCDIRWSWFKPEFLEATATSAFPTAVAMLPAIYLLLRNRLFPSRCARLFIFCIVICFIDLALLTIFQLSIGQHWLPP